DLVRAQADMVARYGPGSYAPPAWVGTALDMMMNLSSVFTLVTLVLLVLLIRDRLIRSRWLRPALALPILLIPLSLVASIAGWLVREIGRQPWAVYGVLRTADAVSDVDRGTMLGSLVAFGTLVVGLLLLDWWLLARQAVRGPGRELLPDEVSTV